MSSPKALQEFKPRYAVRLAGKTATFLWSSSPDAPLKSSVDLKVKSHVSEILWLAKNMGCPLNENLISVRNLDAYNRLIIYAWVRSTIKNPETAKRLASLVLDINSWDALYWASRLRELYWNREKYSRRLRLAKAFKLFFGLE